MTEMRPGHLRGYYPLWPAVSTTSYTQRPVGIAPLDHNSHMQDTGIFGLSCPRFTRRY